MPWSPAKRVRKLAWVPVVPLTPAAAQGRQPVLDLGEVEDEVLRPEAGALADRRQLRRLEVGVGETGQGPVPPGESRQADERGGDPAPRSSSASRISN